MLGNMTGPEADFMFYVSQACQLVVSKLSPKSGNYRGVFVQLRHGPISDYCGSKQVWGGPHVSAPRVRSANCSYRLATLPPVDGIRPTEEGLIPKLFLQGSERLRKHCLEFFDRLTQGLE